MYIRNTLLVLGLGLSVMATSARATVIDMTYDNWSNSVVSNAQTVSWTFDFSSYALTPDTVIESAALSITAQGVDGTTGDPVSVDANLVLGNLTPGNGTTQFDLLGITGTYEYLLDGMLTVSVTANEVTQYSEDHSFIDTHYSRQRHYNLVHHGILWWHNDDWHPYYDSHPYRQYHPNTHVHTRAGSLELISSNLNIVAQDPVDVPEPSTLLLMSLGLVGVAGFRPHASKS